MKKDNDLNITYKILNELNNVIDEQEPDLSNISFDSLEISEKKWSMILLGMKEQGLINGVEFIQGCSSPKLTDTTITLEGIKYLRNNSTKAKIFRAAKELNGFIR